MSVLHKSDDIRNHFVYWLFDADDNCLYVGMTRQPEARWRQHHYNRPQMVARVARRRMAGPFTKAVARRLEREQQDDLQPVFDVNQRRMRERAQMLPCAVTKYTWADEVRRSVVPTEDEAA